MGELVPLVGGIIQGAGARGPVAEAYVADDDHRTPAAR